MKKWLIYSVMCGFLLLFSACKQEIPILKVNDPAPDFSLADLKGETRTLSELKGKVVFINFWATWCPPCIKEMPSMQKLYEKLEGENFEMLALLNNDKPEKAFYFANRNDIDIPILNDSQNKVGIKYSLTGLPETYIIDKQGIVREKFIGPAEWDSPENIKMIQKYINQK